jgi:benzaldehyde dehydrogenase (NAD)
VPGAIEAGEAMCSDPNIAMIQFTGSTAAGRKIGALAGGHLKKLSLELGGKNSLIVLEDADLDIAASNAAWGAFLHQGQICMASGRILVHSAIHDAFAEKLAARARNLPVGDPARGQVAIGPMINSHQLGRVQDIVERSVSAGARLIAGGEANEFFHHPTVLADVRREMPAYTEEVFGPVAALTSFDSDDEAVEFANDTAYGLSAGIISNSVGRAMALGERLRVGLLHINGQTVADEVVNPFGGRGQSGNGTSIGGPANWDEFSQWQWVTIRDKAQSFPF